MRKRSNTCTIDYSEVPLFNPIKDIFLKAGGYLAVPEISWITSARPKENFCINASAYGMIVVDLDGVRILVTFGGLTENKLLNLKL